MIKLEDDPSDERLQLIFRAAHTLKGSSRAMGFARFAELTHEMENILDMLRSGQLTVTTESGDALLASIDMLAQMKDAIQAGQSDNGVETGLLVAQLQAIASGGSQGPAAAAPKREYRSAGFPPHLWDALEQASSQSPVHHLKVRLAADCAMKFVRVYMVLSAIQVDGEVLAACPPMEDLEEERFDRDFDLAVQSVRSAEIVAAQLREITEIESVNCSAWTRPSGEARPEPVRESPAQSPLPAATNAATPKTEPVKKSDANQTVRVDVGRLDTLMNLVGELVIDRTRIARIGLDLSRQFSDPNIDALNETVGHIARITSDLQDQIMKVRMMPIETVFNRYPRVVRDLANKLGKDVRLEIEGGDTELDRSVIEVIGDPLLHLIRNSLDHGLEKPDEREARGKSSQGVLRISARHHENHIVLEVSDDGRGIDPEKLKAKALASGTLTQEQAARMTDREALGLIFGSGFSTAKEVSEVSGRGVGMDIVRSNLSKLGGIIDLDSKVGEGTRFTLRLPLTLAIIRGLLVCVHGRVYVLPLGTVVETLLLKDDEVQSLNRKEVIVLRGVTTPLIRLSEKFQASSKQNGPKSETSYVVIVGLADQRVGLVVDELIGEQEVVIKSLSRYVGDCPGLSGATILGDGNVALIVDVNSLVPMDRG
jgi:two-component system chemotaxis sensor kinase CheA